jgi:flagellar motility protein MotE (MotC chaperone)
MNLRVAVPRLMPITIAGLGALLIVKTVTLVRDTTAFLHHSAAGVSVVAEARAAVPDKPPAAEPAPSVPSRDSVQPPTVSEGERTVLLELRQRRQELDRRELALNARESILAAAEQKLSARVEELSALQKSLEALEAAREQREDAGWQGLVKLYQDMKPRDAATIFNDLDMPVLLAVLDRMKEAKAALIMAAMNPDKAREVTARLAELRIKRENPGSARTGG